MNTDKTPVTYQDPYNHIQARHHLESPHHDLPVTYIGTVIDPTQRHRILHLFTDNNSPTVYVMSLIAGTWRCVS